MNNRSVSTESGRNPFAYRYIGFLPDNLDIDMLLSRHPIAVGFFKSDPTVIRSNMIYLLSLLYYQYHKQKDKGSIESPESYIRLCRDNMKPIVRNYNEYFTWLLQNGIIEKNYSWQSKVACQGYRYTTSYREGIKKPRKAYIYDKAILDRLKKIRQQPEAIKQYQHLYDWFYQLDYDSDKAKQIMSSLSVNEELEMQKLNKLRNSDLWTFKVGKTGRLYSPITNIKSELRECLHVFGEKLIGIDIKSSIPFVSTCLFDSSFIKRNKDLIDSYCKDSYPSFRLPSYIMCPTKAVLTADVTKYIDDVRSDDIYNKLKNIWNKELKTSYTRNTAKKKMLSILNSPKYIESPERDQMSLEYPSVMRFFDEMNDWFTLKGSKKKKHDDFAPFAHVTQSFESRYVLGLVSTRLNEEYPHVPIYTIHDAIYTTEEYKGLVKQVIREESKRFFGVEVKTN